MEPEARRVEGCTLRYSGNKTDLSPALCDSRELLVLRSALLSPTQKTNPTPVCSVSLGSPTVWKILMKADGGDRWRGKHLGGGVTQTNIDKVIKTSSHPFPESSTHPAWSTVSCEVGLGKGSPERPGSQLINPSFCQLPLTPGTTPGPEPRVAELPGAQPGRGRGRPGSSPGSWP